MGFILIDPVLDKWSKRNKIVIVTQDRDWEVRSITIDGSVRRGRNYRIWIDEPLDRNHIDVHIRNMHSPSIRRDYRTTLWNLEELLDTLLSKALGL